MTVFVVLCLIVVVGLVYRLPRIRWSPLGRYLGVRIRLDSPSRIALTFDDGPHPLATPRILDVLERQGVRATFFMVGDHVERYPETARAVFDAGHEIGAHGMRHVRHTWRLPIFIARDMRACVRTIENATGTRPRLFRPPYGKANIATHVAAKLLGMKFVLWSCDGQEWTPEATAESWLSLCLAATGGDIVLMHDREYVGESGVTMEAVLDEFLTTLKDRNITVGAVSES